MPWRPCSGHRAPTSVSSSPGARTPASTPPARSAISTSRSTPGRRCPGGPRPPRRWHCCGGCAASCPATSGSAPRGRPRQGSTPGSGALRRRYAYRLCDDPAGVPPLLRRHVVAVPAPSTSLPWGRRAPRSWGCTTSPRSAGGARARRRSAPCSSTAGPGTPAASSSPASSRTPSATPWSARSSAGPSPSGRAAGPSAGSPMCSRAASAIPASSSPPPTGLVLEEVVYPPDDEVAARAAAARAVRTLRASC